MLQWSVGYPNVDQPINNRLSELRPTEAFTEVGMFEFFANTEKIISRLLT